MQKDIPVHLDISLDIPLFQAGLMAILYLVVDIKNPITMVGTIIMNF